MVGSELTHANMEVIDVTDLIEPRIESKVLTPDKKKIVIVKKEELQSDFKEEERYYPVTINGEEFVPSTATWKAYCGHYEEAIKLYICSVYESDHRIFYNLGFCYNALEKFDEALFYFDNAIKNQPDFIKPYFVKVQILTTLKKFQEAEKTLGCIMRLSQDDDDEILSANRSNIYECLIHEGFDEERAGFGSTYYPTIEQAKQAVQQYEENMNQILFNSIKKFKTYWKETRHIIYLLRKNFCQRKLREQSTDEMGCATS